MTNRIDAHQHFWHFVPEHYSWIDDGMAALRRDFGPEHLAPELDAAGIDGSVLVEARAHTDETDRMLDIAERTPFVKGVVGWLPLTEDDAPALVERYAGRAALRGVRHWVGPADDVETMFDPALRRGVDRLRGTGLSFDLMLWPPQLDGASRFVDQHPDQVFVLDHFAKPPIARGELEPWRSHLRELSRRANVYCKLSGLATEARHDTWGLGDLRPYLDAAVEAFTPARMLFGSDWPVCTLATSFGRWHQTVSEWSAPLSDDERERLFGGTAVDAYRL